jgi:hypothetical protein
MLQFTSRSVLNRPLSLRLGRRFGNHRLDPVDCPPAALAARGAPSDHLRYSFLPPKSGDLCRLPWVLDSSRCTRLAFRRRAGGVACGLQRGRRRRTEEEEGGWWGVLGVSFPFYLRFLIEGRFFRKIEGRA